MGRFECIWSLNLFLRIQIHVIYFLIFGIILHVLTRFWNFFEVRQFAHSLRKLQHWFCILWSAESRVWAKHISANLVGSSPNLLESSRSLFITRLPPLHISWYIQINHNLSGLIQILSWKCLRRRKLFRNYRCCNLPFKPIFFALCWRLEWFWKWVFLSFTVHDQTQILIHINFVFRLVFRILIYI